jgi:hypothetical protein
MKYFVISRGGSFAYGGVASGELQSFVNAGNGFPGENKSRSMLHGLWDTVGKNPVPE